MNKVENAVIKYQLDLEAYKNGQADEVIALLDRANAEIAKYVKKTQGVYTKARYKEIERKLKEISARLKTEVEEGTDIDGLIDYELHKQEKILGLAKDYIKDVPGGRIDFIYPSREQIKTAALFKPIDTKYGMTFQSYLDGIESGLHDTWDAAVRTGYLTGQPTAQIVRNVLGGVSPEAKLKMPGSMNALRNSIYANTRTALQSFANETRNRVMEANEKYFGDGKSGYKYEYLATLDSRTCVACGSMDSKLFKKLTDAPELPQHRGCRCVIIPFFDIEGDFRASKNGYVDSKTNFEGWLKEQDEKTQREVLGATRFELFRRGESMKQFVSNNTVLTLEELNKKLDIKSVLSNNIKEPDINKLSDHVKERFSARGITEADVLDAINNPLKRGEVRIKDGAYQIVGEKATIGVSAFDGTITTAWKTGSRLVKKLKGES